MKLSKSVKPIRYLTSHASEIVNDNSPNLGMKMVAPQGEAKVILQDVISFEQSPESLALLKILTLSATHHVQGLKPVREAFTLLNMMDSNNGKAG
jgi:hypothetical protein